ncbi:MAG: FISUMP domain-containing protein, partial [Ignavibacteriaceae bacterium]|nr:FISUMP domain-containing protein [Ignavibacteriaceae bacterium]
IKYGGLYQWNEAMQYNKNPGVRGICPAGWHMPTIDEFATLTSTVNFDANTLKGKGQENDTGQGMNISGFSGLLSGYYLSNGIFYALGSYTYFWSSKPKDETNDSCIYLNNNSGNINQSTAMEMCGFSIRCIKNENEILQDTSGIDENKIMKKANVPDNKTKEKKSSWKAFCPEIPIVNYAGKTYHTVQIGNQCWLKENLNAGVMINGASEQMNNGIIEKYCYINDSANCNIYGGLYQWNEAMQYGRTPGAQGICPDGWHIPTIDEFATLIAEVQEDGNSLKSVINRVDETGTNTSDFSALMSGCRRYNGEFDDVDNATYFWYSTEKGALKASDMFLISNNGKIYEYNNDKLLGFSIRCIKNK